MPPTLYLIDGHALAYRMYFALTAGGSSQRWQTSSGEPTAGTYGFARELLPPEILAHYKDGGYSSAIVDCARVCSRSASAVRRSDCFS